MTPPAPELVLLIGIPAAGKSTFARERLFATHVRLNLDMLRTRHRESLLFDACLAAKAHVAIDNTNLTTADRARYLAPARAAGHRCVGYYFQSILAAALPRNAARNAGLPANRQIPDKGVAGAAGRLELPRMDEGFDALWYVRLTDGGFAVEPWKSDPAGGTDDV